MDSARMPQTQSIITSPSHPKGNHTRLLYWIPSIIAIWYGQREHYYSIYCVLSACIGLWLVSYIFLSSFTRKEYLWVSMYFFSFWSAYFEPLAGTEPVVHPYRILPTKYEITIAFWALSSMLATYCGYIIGNWQTKVSPFFPCKKIPLNTIKKLSYSFLGLYIIRLIIGEENLYFSGIIGCIFISIPGLFLALSTMFFCRGGHSFCLFLLAIAGGFVMLLESLAGLLFIRTILLFMPALVVLFLEKKYKLLVIIATILFILLLPAYMSRGDMREISWGKQSDNNVTLIDTLSFGIKVLQQSFSDMGSSITDKQKQVARSRNELMTYWGQAIIYHEIYNHPYRYGETFWWLPLVCIPRIIFPWKPINTMATTMAVEYGCSGGGRVAMNFPALVEFYINFGFWGIIPLSFLLGMGMRYSIEKFAHGEGDINLAFVIMIFLPLSRVEGNITLIYGEVLNCLVLCWIATSIMKTNNYCHTKKGASGIFVGMI